MPSLRYSASSVDEIITEKKASQPCNCLSPSMTRAATGLVALVIDNALSVSSECKRRFTLLRCWRLAVRCIFRCRIPGAKRSASLSGRRRKRKNYGSVKPTLTYERGALIREEVQTFSLWPLLLNGYRYSKARGVHVQHQCSGCGS